MRPILEVIKEETTTLHRHVEQTEIMRRIFSDQFKESDYIKLLSVWYRLISDIELNIIERIDELDLTLPDLKSRFKSQLIADDLAALGVTALPSLESTYKFSLNQLYGAMYVIEGSSLGAKIISQQLLKHSFVDDNNCQFYNGYREETGFMWKTFKDCVNQWGENNEDAHDEVVDGAKNTFKLLRAAFDKIGV